MSQKLAGCDSSSDSTQPSSPSGLQRTHSTAPACASADFSSLPLLWISLRQPATYTGRSVLAQDCFVPTTGGPTGLAKPTPTICTRNSKHLCRAAALLPLCCCSSGCRTAVQVDDGGLQGTHLHNNTTHRVGERVWPSNSRKQIVPPSHLPCPCCGPARPISAHFGRPRMCKCQRHTARRQHWPAACFCCLPAAQH